MVTWSNLLNRPNIGYEQILKMLELSNVSIHSDYKNIEEVLEQVEISLKYEGYIKLQLEQIEEFKKTEQMKIPAFVELTF